MIVAAVLSTVSQYLKAVSEQLSGLVGNNTSRDNEQVRYYSSSFVPRPLLGTKLLLQHLLHQDHKPSQCKARWKIWGLVHTLSWWYKL